MDKELEALNRIRKSHFTAMACLGIEKPDNETIEAIEYVEQALTTKSDKELAFDIIVKKRVDIFILKQSLTTKQYNIRYSVIYGSVYKDLTQEEFELLKRCLNNE